MCRVGFKNSLNHLTSCTVHNAFFSLFQYNFFSPIKLFAELDKLWLKILEKRETHGKPKIRAQGSSLKLKRAKLGCSWK